MKTKHACSTFPFSVFSFPFSAFPFYLPYHFHLLLIQLRQHNLNLHYEVACALSPVVWHALSAQAQLAAGLCTRFYPCFHAAVYGGHHCFAAKQQRVHVAHNTCMQVVSLACETAVRLNVECYVQVAAQCSAGALSAMSFNPNLLPIGNAGGYCYGNFLAVDVQYLFVCC